VSSERLRKALQVNRFVYVNHVIVVFTARLILEPKSSASGHLYAAPKLN
jgi:hypothetical protein